jgi:hypothetical protein
MSDQIKDTDYAYLAGMIDGEGYISILHHNKKIKVSCRGYELESTLKLTSMNKDLLDSIQKTFNMGKIVVMKDKRRREEDDTIILIYDLRFRVSEQRIILPKVIPYLRYKKKIAEIILNFLTIRQSPIPQKAKEEEYKKTELQLYDAVMIAKPWLAYKKTLE